MDRSWFFRQIRIGKKNTKKNGTGLCIKAGSSFILGLINETLQPIITVHNIYNYQYTLSTNYDIINLNILNFTV
ncbi:MAG: hypothetical protein ACI8WT_002088 [Clostridium sp.]|jgi:hypothetical protein